MRAEHTGVALEFHGATTFLPNGVCIGRRVLPCVSSSPSNMPPLNRMCHQEVMPQNFCVWGARHSSAPWSIWQLCNHVFVCVGFPGQIPQCHSRSTTMYDPWETHPGHGDSVSTKPILVCAGAASITVCAGHNFFGFFFFLQVD